MTANQYQVQQCSYRSIRYFIIKGNGFTLLLAGANMPFSFRFDTQKEAISKANETIDNFWESFGLKNTPSQ